jgi:hypothetical protein
MRQDERIIDLMTQSDKDYLASIHPDILTLDEQDLREMYKFQIILEQNVFTVIVYQTIYEFTQQFGLPEHQEQATNMTNILNQPILEVVKKYAGEYVNTSLLQMSLDSELLTPIPVNLYTAMCFCDLNNAGQLSVTKQGDEFGYVFVKDLVFFPTTIAGNNTRGSDTEFQYIMLGRRSEGETYPRIML